MKTKDNPGGMFLSDWPATRRIFGLSSILADTTYCVSMLARLRLEGLIRLPYGSASKTSGNHYSQNAAITRPERVSLLCWVKDGMISHTQSSLRSLGGIRNRGRRILPHPAGMQSTTFCSSLM